MVSPDTTEGADDGFRWPPPGLERMQGDLWRAARSGWLGGALLVLPLLVVVTTRWELSSLGPLAGAWWVGALVATAGLAFVIDEFGRLARMARRSMHAVDRGYDLRTVLCVLGDARRDMGFLLRGARHFSEVERPDRDLLVAVRLLAVGLLTGAGAWLALALVVGLFAAARGWMEPTTFRYLTLLPAGLAYLVGGVLALTDEVRVRRARRAWHTGAWEDDLDPERIATWRARAGLEPSPAGAGAWPGRLRRMATVFSVCAVVVVVPVLLLLPVSAVGPLVASVAFPGYDGIQRRAAELEVYRVYRVSPDPAITPGEAGRLLQTLAYVGEEGSVPDIELEPPVRIAEDWLPGDGADSPIGLPSHLWHDTVFALARDQPSVELRSYLAGVAGHPARADFARLARALRLDAASGRWRQPFPEDRMEGGLPAPRLLGVRRGSGAMVAAAAHELIQGRPDVAETLMREIISVGFLLADQGPTLQDNLLGQSMVREGGIGLERLLEATGQTERARELAGARATGTRAAGRMPAPAPESPEAMARMLPGLVLDSTAVRGLAWESFAVMSTLAPCMNLNRVVFGPDDAHREFVEAAHDALVRWPSEEGLFQLASRGLFEPREASPFGPLRLLTLAVRSGEGSCAEVLGRFGTGTERE